MSLRASALVLILLSGLLAILGEWSTSGELARAWCLPAALLLLGLAYEAAVLARDRLQLELHSPEHWPLARVQPTRYSFRHASSSTLVVEAALSAPAEFAYVPRVETLRLAPGSTASVSLVAAARGLGHYPWPAPTLRVCGALGLAWWPRRVTADCTVTVVPDIVSRAELLAGELTHGEQRGVVVGAGAEVLQLREYRPDDSLRVVDWKASARRGRLISRDFSEDQHLEVVVAIDAGRASGLGAGEVDRLGLYVSVAARIVQRAAAHEDAVGVVVFAAQPLATLAPARGDAAVIRVREILTACRVQPSESNPVIAAARIRALTPRRSLIILLTDLEDPSAGGQLSAAVQLLSPKHFPLIAGVQNARIAELPQASVRERLGAYRALAALEYGNTVTVNLRILRALGAAALTARPERLDQAVFQAYMRFRQRRRI
jgi:uncharacterized protein (DUF58 family)